MNNMRPPQHDIATIVTSYAKTARDTIERNRPKQG
jgi:hypothetical protein